MPQPPRIPTTSLRELPADRAAELPPLLHALWQDAHGNWQEAHSLAQDVDTPDGALVHAYLHRKEGDHFNASYWYRRAGRPVFQGSLEAEWDYLEEALKTP